jgi:Zn-dependent M28 family amino/carboxypeptidase
MIKSNNRFAYTVVVILIAITPIAVFPQKRRVAPRVAAPQVLERNVRAELNFLASDAMQGRGSGTNYERVAAEYIGSMFQQFGLEPAGDADATGRKGYVQRVALETTRITEPPTMTVGSGADAKRWQFGRDFLVSFLRTPKISGEIQVIEGDATPAKGAIALLRLPEGASQQTRQELILKAYSAQAAGALVVETDANKTQRESGNARLPTLPPRIASNKSTDQAFGVISLPGNAFNELAAMPKGTRLEFEAKTQMAESNTTWNAVGVLIGNDPAASSEVIILSAHLDHLGVRESASGDGIYNGADDDASGCVVVLELARVLSSGSRPRRTIYFVCFGSEERGGHGSRYFIDQSPVPIDKIVANIQFEMLGRPDAKVPANTLWLTGYERSTLGPELARRGAKLVADPHPEQNFFQRSDNYTLALKGVVAHTVSSYGLHTDYHRPSDEISKIDFPYMTQSINSLVNPIRWLTNSTFRPAWLPGQAPSRNTSR